MHANPSQASPAHSASCEARRAKPRVLVLTLSDLALDGRVRRQLEFLRSDYDVVAASIGPPLRMDGVRFVGLDANGGSRSTRLAERLARAALRLARRYERAYWLDSRTRRWRKALHDLGRPDVLIVNDLWGVPAALAVSDGAPVIFDSHEHWTSESASWSLTQRLSMQGAHEWIVDRMVPKAAAVMTVSDGIADEYARRLGRRPLLITNAPFHHALQPTPVGTPIRLLHVGIADERRRLEDTIDVVRGLDDRFTLDMVLARDNGYRRRLEKMAVGEDRIRILEPVARDDLIPLSNRYDVGVFLLPARFPNQVHVLPNKLFDYIQARLAVAIGPSPEMARIVREWDCGVVSESFSPAAFARVLAGLTASEVERFKWNAHRAADVFTADRNRVAVRGLVARVITDHAERQTVQVQRS